MVTRVWKRLKQKLKKVRSGDGQCFKSSVCRWCKQLALPELWGQVRTIRNGDYAEIARHTKTYQPSVIRTLTLGQPRYVCSYYIEPQTWPCHSNSKHSKHLSQHAPHSAPARFSSTTPRHCKCYDASV